MSKYFKYEEFDSPDVQGSGQLISKDLLDKLDKVREDFGKPIIVTSGYRTIRHNAKVGGKNPDKNGYGGSSHLHGLAADISCKNSSDRFKLVQILLKVGFKRIGIGSSFIHIDIDTDKAQNLIWTY